MKNKMKAVICTKYGPPEVLKLVEIEKPQHQDDEVLIRNYGTSINTVDMLHRGGKAPKVAFWGIKRLVGFFLRREFGGLRKPKQKIVGGGFVGEIVSIGTDVSDWSVGDHVYGYSEKGGACAEYMAVPASVLAKKPSNLSFQEAAAVPGGSTPALVAFRDLVTPNKGDKVLIIGASGGIGTFAVQMAKNVYGAEVTGVCGPTNVDMVKEIGADFVIDYSKEDYTKSDSKYDIILDVVSAQNLSKCKNILASEGTYIANNPISSPRNIFHIMTNNKRFKTGTADESAAAMNLICEWIEEGKIKPVIDTVYPLSQTVEAHRHYETGRSKGRVVISIE
ncbi:MAG: NAD(P)-dependent alcohol dehydrogenase [Candidatus Heimdallarchaeota archaeon]|nr:MAG: NAD(P)-dependent alcohol dehydrogenase [Candidatus Heimdallarchaeota archaeon]